MSQPVQGFNQEAFLKTLDPQSEHFVAFIGKTDKPAEKTYQVYQSKGEGFELITDYFLYKGTPPSKPSEQIITIVSLFDRIIYSNDPKINPMEFTRLQDYSLIKMEGETAWSEKTWKFILRQLFQKEKKSCVLM